MYQQRRAPRRIAPAALLFLLLVPFVASACITVESDLLATPTPTVAEASSAAPPTQAPLASPTPAPTPAPTLEPLRAEVLGFVPHRLLGPAARSVDPSLLTIAAFHSLEASQDGTLPARKPNGDVSPGWAMLRSERFLELKDELQAAGVKVVPVIERTASTDGTRERMITLLSRKKNRRALSQAIADLVAKRGFDGVNLDFRPLPAKVADDYVALVREVRAALDEVDPGLHLSVDLVPGLENYDLAALTADDAADLAVIMGYGYRTASSAVAGSVAPLEDPVTSDLSTSVREAVRQVEPEKLLLALPWYGHAWPTESSKARSRPREGKDIEPPATIDYAAAVEQAARSGRRYEPDQASAWTAYPSQRCSGCPSTWRQLWYDDADSFGAKVDLALEQDLAGVGIWALGMDEGHDELAAALRNRLRPLVDEQPPGGTPALDPDTVMGDIDGRAVVSGSAVLRLFGDDEAGGSGLGYVRVGLDGRVDGDGRLVTGRTYPAVDRVVFPLGDESTGGSATEGPRAIHVQWRDLAGNWSVPVVIAVQVLDPQTTTTPGDL